MDGCKKYEWWILLGGVPFVLLVSEVITWF